MPPLKPIKSSLKGNILMVLYMVFNGEINKKLMINYTIIIR